MSLFDWLRPARPTRRRRRKTAGAKECGHCATTLPDGAAFCFVCGREVDASAYAPPRRGGGASGSFGELQARLARTLDGRYLIRDVLGAGGMGVVFLADDLGLDRSVAIKVLPPEVADDATVVSRFRKEAKTAARLDHPGIIPIYRVENEGGLDYFIMKYVAGRSLEAVLRDEAPLSLETTARILREAAAALAHAHRHGVVHRDVKPANIMLDADDRVILTDFGISKASSAATDATTEPRLTELGTAIGTPQYMAPEQAVGHAVDGRADQYALGIVGFEMLAGYVPFDDETPHAIIHRQISEAPPDLAAVRPDVPRHVAATIAKALRKSPSSRFAKMEQFAAALDDPTMSLTTSPTGTRRVAAAAGLGATRVLAADDSELDTALDRVFDSSAHAPSRGGRWFVWLMMLMVLASALGAVAWARGDLTVSGIKPPARAGRTAPKATTRPAAPAKAAAGRHKAAARRTLPLTVTSTPRATLFIDGTRIGETPVTNRALTVGRTYRLRIEKKGYRTKSETITANGTRPLRRGYVLERVARR